MEKDFYKKILENDSYFIKSALVGGTIGIISSIIIKRNYFLLPLSGFLLGGYIGNYYKESKNSLPKSEFKVKS